MTSGMPDPAAAGRRKTTMPAERKTTPEEKPAIHSQVLKSSPSSRRGLATVRRTSASESMEFLTKNAMTPTAKPMRPIMAHLRVFWPCGCLAISLRYTSLLGGK